MNSRILFSVSQVFVCLPLWGVPANRDHFVAVDLEKSKGTVEFFAVARPSFLRIHGTIKEGNAYPLKGHLRIRGLKLEGRATFVLDSLQTGMESRSRKMHEEYLETHKWPLAEFALETLLLPSQFWGEEQLRAKVPFSGLLSFHGVQKKISGETTVEKNASELNMDFRFEVALHEFQIENPRFLGMEVKDSIEIRVHLGVPLEVVR